MYYVMAWQASASRDKEGVPRGQSEVDHEAHEVIQAIQPQRKYIGHVHWTFLYSSYLSYRYDLVTLNILEHISRRDKHSVQAYATILSANINPHDQVFPLGPARSSHYGARDSRQF